MLRPSLQSEVLEQEGGVLPIQVNAGIGNPFPGLRPFTPDECHLFFGREGQVDDILLKLSEHHFVTVMGYSGSGKSSLMYCGLIPVLYGGLVTETSPAWQVVLSRPGASPYETLTASIVGYLREQGRIEEEDEAIHKSIIISVLRSGPKGLVDIARYLQIEKGENVFFLVDQFEELFRPREGWTQEEIFNDGQAFVNLLLHAIKQREVPIYVALAMRSDFVGMCVQYAGLAEQINNSNYLVPQMGREQKKMAIEGPVAVAGGRISQRLVKKLLGEVGKEQDQLPIMQHSLMRTWDYWLSNHEPGEPMDLRHYNAIGKMGGALSQHANECYELLSSREKEIAEVLFKSVTERSNENRGMRRPCPLNTIAQIAEASESDVMRVVDHFRMTGRSFLMPAAHVPLTSESTIELSHESMMRIWNRLDAWVEEEFESAQIYKRISDAAAMYQIGKTGLWRPPDLQLALNWQRKQRPTRAWAARYDEAFERAIVFLDTSRITYEAELKNQEMLQRRMLRRARATAVILGFAALVAIIFFVFAFLKKIEADSKTLEAQEAQKEADTQRIAAEDRQHLADSLRIIAQDVAEQLQEQYAVTRQALEEAKQARAEAEHNLERAIAGEKSALDASEKEKEQRLIAEEQTRLATQNFERANQLYMLSIAQALAAKSDQEDDDVDLAGLEAMQAWHFHRRFGGKRYDPYIYRGLYHALTLLMGSSYNAIKVPGPPRNRINSLALMHSSNKIYAAGADGRIFLNDIDKLSSVPVGIANPYPNKVIALSPNENVLAVGSDSVGVQIYSLNDLRQKPLVIRNFRGSTHAMEFLPDNSALIVAKSDRSIYSVDYRGGATKKLAAYAFDIRSLDVSPDGRWIAAGSPDGKLVLLDVSTGVSRTLADDADREVLSVQFSPDGSLLAYGTYEKKEQRGGVVMYNMNTDQVDDRQFGGHKAGVYDIAFSPDGKLMASAGADKRIQMWVLDSPADLPIEMENNNSYIWDIAFAKGSDYLIAACHESEIRVWPTNPELLADQVCPKLSRNLTTDEWNKYVGNDIEYESTCVNLLINDF